MPRHLALPASAGLLAATAAAGGYVALRQPPAVVGLLARQRAVVVSVPVSGGDRLVAVTVDDGPSPELTPRLLEVLDRHGSRATFLMLGSRAQAHPEVVAAAHCAGHEIGNHGWLDRPAVRLSRAELRDDVRRSGEAIAAATGVAPRLFRPGSGWLTPGQLRDVRASGLTVVLGSVAVLDLAVADVGREVRFVADRLRPGAVAVLHEGRPERAGVVALLDGLLDEVTRRGYTAVTVSELLEAARR